MSTFLLLNDPERLIAWAQDQLGVIFFDDARAIGWGNGETIRAVAVYERWSGNDCCVHLVSDRRPGWMSRHFLAAGFKFPFVQGRVRRITGLVPASNVDALRLNTHMGYRVEGRLRCGADDGGDLIVMGMLREECRFLPREFRMEEIHG